MADSIGVVSIGHDPHGIFVTLDQAAWLCKQDDLYECKICTHPSERVFHFRPTISEKSLTT